MEDRDPWAAPVEAGLWGPGTLLREHLIFPHSSHLTVVHCITLCCCKLGIVHPDQMCSACLDCIGFLSCPTALTCEAKETKRGNIDSGPGPRVVSIIALSSATCSLWMPGPNLKKA